MDRRLLLPRCHLPRVLDQHGERSEGRLWAAEHNQRGSRYLKKDTHRLVQTFLEKEILLVHLPGGNQIIRSAMEDLAIYLGLPASVSTYQISSIAKEMAHVMNSGSTPNVFPEPGVQGVTKTVRVNLGLRSWYSMRFGAGFDC